MSETLGLIAAVAGVIIPAAYAIRYTIKGD